jgi:formylglycine-generating enzyme required for sulfatase activity
LDMSGNVWEWCSSGRADYPYRAGDGREDVERDVTRALRGGSWLGRWRDARCACRRRLYPDGYDNFVGFRVVFPGSPPSDS